MKQIPLHEMTMLQLQIFIVAGNELNFTKTAQQLFVTQPTVSRSISALENMTGLVLFTKNHGQMRLTPAGKKLHQQLTEAWEKINSGFVRAAEIQEGYKDALIISVPEWITTTFLSFAQENLRKKHPNAKLHYQAVGDFSKAVQDLFNYETDVLITHLHNRTSIEPYQELHTVIIKEVPLLAFMKQNNQLSGKESITFADLRNQKILIPRDNTEANYSSMLMKAFAEHNVLPRISSYVTHSAEGIMNLQEDNEVIILNEYATASLHTDCVGIPIEETSSGLILAIRKADKDNELYQDFVNFIGMGSPGC